MKLLRFKWLGPVVMLFASLVISGCGGGGGGGSTPVAKATISGAVTFPTINNLVAKRLGSSVALTDGTVVEAYTIDGTKVASITPTYEDPTGSGQRIYSYAFTGLDLGRDYVIKAKRNAVALKKLIEKKDVKGDLPGQNLSAVSTAAVIVASNKIGATLGDPLPAGKTVDAVSTTISTDIKPVLLEGAISAVVEGGTAAVTDSNLAEYANVNNIVVTAAANNVDPSAMFTATPPTLTATVPILTVAAGSTTATITQTTVDATVVSNSATPTYTPPVETAATYNTLAKQYLASQDISNASLNYEKALSIDPNDAEANFGGAITSGMMMIENPDVQAVTTKWGAIVPTVNQIVQGTSPIKLPFGNMTSIRLMPKTVAKSVAKSATATSPQNVLAAFSLLKASLPQQKAGFKSLAKELKLVPATAPSISEMQTVITNVIIPKVDTILARLAKAEGKGISFTVTKAMQGNPVNGTDTVLNDGEFYTLDAALNLFQVVFKMASAYNFDVPAPYTYDTIGQDPLAMINGSTFFTLKSDGLAKMSGALANAQTAAAKAKSAYDVIVARTTGTGAFDIATWTQLQKDDFTTGLASVTAALSGAYSLAYNENNVAKTVTIDVTKFFTNPLTKANLPAFGYDVPRNATLSADPKYGYPVAAERTITNYYFNGTSYVANGTRKEAIDCGIVPTSDLPDYTLNGILPGSTRTSNFAGFNGVLPMVGGSLFHSLVGGVPSYDYTEPNANLDYATDGTYLYRLKQNVSTTSLQLFTRIQKVDPATGEVLATLTGVPNNVYKIVYVNGQWLVGSFGWNPTNGNTLDLYNFTSTTTSPWTLSTTPVASIVIGNNGWLNAITSSGNDVYYALNKSVFNATLGYYTTVAEIHKLNMTTFADTAINSSIPHDIYALGVSSGFIFTNSDKFDIDKRSGSTGDIVSSYISPAGNFDVIIGGFFYKNDMGKLIKYAGTPDGTAAKLAKYFGF